MAPQVLEQSELDPIDQEVAEVMTKAEEEAAERQFTRTPPERIGDLTDGGSVNGAQLFPTRGGVPQRKGRPVAIRAWTWNGTETLLPLGWNPGGTDHNGAQPSLRKRHCLCCNYSGFRGLQCPSCVKRSCTNCKSGTDRSTPQEFRNGKRITGWIIPCFYLREEDVPSPSKFFGPIDCFLESCIRRGSRGFLTQHDMRMHARTRHRMEYQSYMEGLAAERQDELESLRKRLDAIQAVPSMAVATAEPKVVMPIAQQKEARQENKKHKIKHRRRNTAKS